MLIIGIDPGGSGGVAWMSENQRVPVARKMPETPLDFVALMQEIVGDTPVVDVKVWLEKVGPMPKQGVCSVWTFAETFWGPLYALAALQIGVELVTPQCWQKAMQCRTKGDKNVSKAKAQQLWPTEKWTHAKADAALICEYGRRAGCLTEIGR